MTVFERVFECFDHKEGPASKADIDNIHKNTGVRLSQEVAGFYSSFGWGEGFCSSTNDKSEYLILFSPDLIYQNWVKSFPKGFIAIGSNGGGEFVMASACGEIGLLPEISDYSTDYMFVAETFEKFIEKSESGGWFDATR